MSSNKFFVRINLLDGYESKIKEFYSDRESYPNVFIGFHTGQSGENPHYHIVHTTDKLVTHSTMRKRFKTVFTKGKGNGHISLKEWDGKIDAIAYIYHEDMQLVPTLMHGFTEEEIAQAKAINVTHHETIKNETPVKVLERVYEKLLSTKPTMKVDVYGQSGYKPRWGHEDIFNAIMDYYQAKGDWMPNRFQMERYIMKVQSMLNSHPDDWQNLRRQWYAEMFPQRN